MNDTTITFAVSFLSFVVNANTFVLLGFPEHRRRQKFRREVDGYAPPWWMCWTYWLGIERWFFGRRMVPVQERQL